MTSQKWWIQNGLFLQHDFCLWTVWTRSWGGFFLNLHFRKTENVVIQDMGPQKSVFWFFCFMLFTACWDMAGCWLSLCSLWAPAAVVLLWDARLVAAFLFLSHTAVFWSVMVVIQPEMFFLSTVGEMRLSRAAFLSSYRFFQNKCHLFKNLSLFPTFLSKF